MLRGCTHANPFQFAPSNPPAFIPEDSPAKRELRSHQDSDQAPQATDNFLFQQLEIQNWHTSLLIFKWIRPRAPHPCGSWSEMLCFSSWGFLWSWFRNFRCGLSEGFGACVPTEIWLRHSPWRLEVFITATRKAQSYNRLAGTPSYGFLDAPFCASMSESDHVPATTNYTYICISIKSKFTWQNLLFFFMFSPSAFPGIFGQLTLDAAMSVPWFLALTLLLIQKTVCQLPSQLSE